MDMPHVYWDETTNHQRVKYEGCSSNDESRIKDDHRSMYCCETNLNFSTANCSEDDSEYVNYKKHPKVARQDPMSHRIIEKRRRDRMNNCLADLSRLIPTEYLKKGRGRIEKTEIIEMAIKHMKYLQQEHHSTTNPSEHYILGYQECMSETMRFLVEYEGHFPREGVCVRILNHLQKHCDSLARVPPPPPPPPPRLQTHSIQPLTTTKPTSHQTPKIEPNTSNNNHQQQQNELTGAIITNGNRNSSSNGTTTTTTNGDYINEKNNNNECLSYKYKTNIKLRFSQDLNEDTKRRKTDIIIERRNSITSENANDEQQQIKEQRMSPTESSTSSLKYEQQPPIQSRHNEITSIIKNPFVKNQNFNVPVFVLHAKGAYYIPLSIDFNTLLPYLRNYDLFEVLPNVVLHPVTINVNFQPNNNNNNNNNNNCKSDFINNNNY